MGNQCCCEESREQSATLVNLSQMQIEETDEPAPVPEEMELPPEPAVESMPPPVVEEKLVKVVEEPEAEAAIPVPVKEVDPIPQAPSTFTVEVVVSGRKLGFGIGHKHGLAAIEVVKLHEDGVIAEWNKTHYPEKQVVVGSRIVALNGVPIVAKERDDMLSDITEAVAAPRLRMEIQPPKSN
mmetsp:Transcript_22973/g.42259  ORF Transcript_22973/g.42259 Transcript_22973/m.42259 type:complete len:182 (+) Transcript_22973:78-623(+)